MSLLICILCILYLVICDMLFTLLIIINSVIMLNTLILRTDQSRLLKMDNLTIKDKMPAPKLIVRYREVPL